MGVGITIPVNMRPFQELKTQLKDANGEIRKLEKQIDEAKKKGDQVSKEVVDKLRAAEKKRDQLQAQANTAKTQQREALRQQAFQASERARLSAKFGSYRPGFGTGLDFGDLRQRVGGFRIAGSSLSSLAGRFLPAAAAVETFRAFGRANDAAAQSLETLREMERDTELATKEGMSAGASKLLSLQNAQREREANLAPFTEGLGGIPIVGGAFRRGADLYNFAAGRLTGTDAVGTQRLELEQAAKSTGVGKAELDRVLDLARDRNRGRMGNQINAELRFLGLEFNSDAAADTKKAIEAIKNYEANTARGVANVERNNFDAAEASFKAAANEVGRTNWRDPMGTWMQIDAGRRSTVQYAINQSPLPPLRIGQ
jgi:cell division protein FtsL